MIDLRKREYVAVKGGRDHQSEGDAVMGISAGYRPGTNVELTEDLTRYHPEWKAGTRGVIVPDAGMWARTSDRFVSVLFDPPVGVRDTLVRSLRFLDAEEETRA